MNPGFALLALMACSAGKTDGDDYFDDDDWACEHEVWDWYAGPVQAVLEADEDGDFSYDPPGDVVTERDGSYDFESGDLAWTSSYAGDYYGVSGEVEGYGTVYPDGDLDLLYRSVFTDVLDEVSHSRVRVERSGCSATTKTWTIDADDDLAATPSDEPFTWNLEIVSDDEVERTASWSDSGEDWEAQGSFTSDLVNTLHYASASGSAIIDSVSYGDGTSSMTQEGHDSDYDSYYQIDGFLDGSRSVANDVYEAGSDDLIQSCSYDISYAGEAEGECTFYQGSSSITCDLFFDSEDCVLDCDDGQQYSC